MPRPRCGEVRDPGQRDRPRGDPHGDERGSIEDPGAAGLVRESGPARTGRGAGGPRGGGYFPGQRRIGVRDRDEPLRGWRLPGPVTRDGRRESRGSPSVVADTSDGWGSGLDLPRSEDGHTRNHPQILRCALGGRNWGKYFLEGSAPLTRGRRLASVAEWLHSSNSSNTGPLPLAHADPEA